MAKKKKYKIENIKKEFDARGYTLLSKDYISFHEKLEYICNKHNDKGVQKIAYSKFHGGQGCYFCGRETMGNKQRLTIDKVKKVTEEKGFIFCRMFVENNKTYVVYKESYESDEKTTNYVNMRKSNKHNKSEYTTESISKILLDKYNIELLEDYKNNSTKTKCKCLKHDYIWYPKINSIFSSNCGCPKCGIEKIVKNKTFTTEKYRKLLKEVNPMLDIVSEYTKNYNDINFKCLKCGEVFTRKANYIYGSCSCPNCDHIYSKGENEVEKYLIKNNIFFEKQKTYDDCIFIEKLRFDFYLSDKNTVIEYDGQQHFKPVEYFGGEIEFKKTKNRDKTKNEYCKKNKIKILRIPYWEFNNIEQILINNDIIPKKCA